MNELRACVQAIEQEVRIELHAQGIEPGAAQLRLKLCGTKLTITQSPVIVDGVDETDYADVNEHVPVKEKQEHPPEHPRPFPPAGRLGLDKPVHTGAQGRVQEDHSRGAKRMKDHSPPPGSAIRIALRQSEDQEGK
jgi:hypothetical protein